MLSGPEEIRYDFTWCFIMLSACGQFREQLKPIQNNAVTLRKRKKRFITLLYISKLLSSLKKEKMMWYSGPKPLWGAQEKFQA